MGLEEIEPKVILVIRNFFNKLLDRGTYLGEKNKIDLTNNLELSIPRDGTRIEWRRIDAGICRS